MALTPDAEDDWRRSLEELSCHLVEEECSHSDGGHCQTCTLAHLKILLEPEED